MNKLLQKALVLGLSGAMAVSLAAGAAFITPAPEVEAASSDDATAWGFLEALRADNPDLVDDIQIAEDILNTSVARGLTSRGSANDATSFTNMVRSIMIMEEMNQYRTSDNNFPGKAEYATNLPIMAMAMVSANSSYDVSKGHLQQFSVGENLSWGYSDPNDGWYVQEKQEYDGGNRTFQRDRPLYEYHGRL